jgi:hypothetical protein
MGVAKPDRNSQPTVPPPNWSLWVRFQQLSSADPLRHFRWRWRFSIESLFGLRFAVEALHPQDLRH